MDSNAIKVCKDAVTDAQRILDEARSTIATNVGASKRDLHAVRKMVSDMKHQVDHVSKLQRDTLEAQKDLINEQRAKLNHQNAMIKTLNRTVDSYEQLAKKHVKLAVMYNKAIKEYDRILAFFKSIKV